VTRSTLAPIRESSGTVDAALLERLASAIESLTSAADRELRTYSPAEAAKHFGKTENWVIEQIQLGSIPYTRIGKTPRLTAAHIRWVLESGEVTPHKYSPRPIAA
jgi:hypothetical protein